VLREQRIDERFHTIVELLVGSSDGGGGRGSRRAHGREPYP
jgi:hypothetical protein